MTCVPVSLNKEGMAFVSTYKGGVAYVHICPRQRGIVSVPVCPSAGGVAYEAFNIFHFNISLSIMHFKPLKTRFYIIIQTV